MKRSFVLGALGGLLLVAVGVLFAWRMSRPVTVLATSACRDLRPMPNSRLSAESHVRPMGTPLRP